MIKYSIILVNMLAIMLVRVFFAGDVSVTMNAPSKVKQGEEVTISLTIHKGSIAGVGHMKQELPAGFGNATVIEAKGGEFKYLPEDNVIKFTWISLPADQDFTVSYKMIVNTDAPNGNVALAGKFSYVLNNEKQTFMLPESSITVASEVLATTTQPETTATATTQPETTATTTTPPETTATTTTQPETTATSVSKPETTAVSTTTQVQPETTATTQPEVAATNTAMPETTATNTTATEAKTSSPVSASRTIVGSPEAGTEFTVELSVKKDGMKGFARIQETLPAGLTAISLDNKGGTFSFLDQKVKIIWDNLPADEDVKVSYRVSVADNVSGNMAITGSFSYVENDDPKKTEIPSTAISVKAKTVMAATTTTTAPTENTNTTSTNTTTTATTENTNAANNNTQTTSTTTTVPEPENKVAYKVQICALSKIQRGTSYFESKFAIGNKVSMELHEGWKKYIVGKYGQYKDARDYRESVRSKGIENPFVTAYNNGKRITVQEALMVSNQQWIR